MKTKVGQEARTRSIISTRETKEGEQNIEYVTKEEVYCPLSAAARSEVDKSWRLKKRKNVPSILPGIKALWKFQHQHSRLPVTSKTDYKDFTLLMTQADQELGLPESLVNSSFIRYPQPPIPRPLLHPANSSRPFVENTTAELSPVAAVLGGLLAQDAINVLGKQEQPIQNLLVFDGDISAAPIIVLAPQDEDVTMMV